MLKVLSIGPVYDDEILSRLINEFWRRTSLHVVRLRFKCDGTRAETSFRLSAKRTSSFKSSGASVQSTTGPRYVRISGSNAGYTMFRGSVKSTGYPHHSPVSPSLPLPCVTVWHNISTGLYFILHYHDTGQYVQKCVLPLHNNPAVFQLCIYLYCTFLWLMRNNKW
jgi:hypothetical protein